MPGGDGTGPMGQGPMTGWGRQAATGRTRLGGRGAGGRSTGGRVGNRGRGRGWRHLFRQTGLTGWQRAMQQESSASPVAEPPSPENAAADSSLDALRQREQQLAAELRAVQAEIERQGEKAVDASRNRER